MQWSQISYHHMTSSSSFKTLNFCSFFFFLIALWMFFITNRFYISYELYRNTKLLDDNVLIVKCMQFILLVICRYECLFLTWCTHPMFANRQLLRFLIVGRRGTLICHIKSKSIRCVSYCDGLPTSTKEELFHIF